jgi:cardiolipin synthase
VSTAAAHQDASLGRVLTLPNFVSLSRLGLLAWSEIALFSWSQRVLAAILLGVCGATDFLDGYAARHLNQVSTIGKMLDPTVDRIVVGTAVISCTVYGAVPAWFSALVVAREALTAGVALYAKFVGATRIDVVFIGKAGTFGLLFAFPLLLGSDAPGTGWSWLHGFSWVLAGVSLALASAASAIYLTKARHALALHRRSPAAPATSAP